MLEFFVVMGVDVVGVGMDVGVVFVGGDCVEYY